MLHERNLNTDKRLPALNMIVITGWVAGRHFGQLDSADKQAVRAGTDRVAASRQHQSGATHLPPPTTATVDPCLYNMHGSR